MIDKTDSTLDTEISCTILGILAEDERADHYEVYEYLPELNFTREACIENIKVMENWSMFRCKDLSSDETGLLCYSSEDRLEFRSVRFVLSRLKRAKKKQNVKA